jgi:hypothetical protein
LFAAYSQGRDLNHLAGEIDSVENEMRDIRNRLEKKDLEPKERERLAYRLGGLQQQRDDAQRAYDEARFRARQL